MSQKHTLRAALSLFVLGIFLSGVVFSDNFYFARSNPTLREYFRQRHLHSLGHAIDIFGTTYYEVDVRFLELQVDRSVEDFLKRVTEKLYALKTHLNEVRQIQKERLSLAPDSKGQWRVQAHWKNSLKSLANEAKDLRKMLSYVFRGLDDQSDFEPEIQKEVGSSGFQKEITFIQKQIAKAEQRINNYLFLPTHTIDAAELKGENMMIYLYRVEKTSQRLSKESPLR